MDAAKVQLSKEEIDLVSDPGWILTKNSIMGRVVQLFADLSERIGPELDGLRDVMEHQPADIKALANWDTPKISKGENYQGLPYVMLDHPRLFHKDHVLAIRTMFWWGHYFSVTLHLKGWIQEMFLTVINRHARELADAGFHFAVSGDEWRHELEGDNYHALKEDSLDIATEYPFLKLSAKCELDEWNEAPEILFGLYKLLVRALSGPH
jgi:hypothetical protein